MLLLDSPIFFQHVVRLVLLLEEKACVDVECTITILLAVLAHGLTVLEADDKILIHDKAQTRTDGDVGTVAVETFGHIIIILRFCLGVLCGRRELLDGATKRHIVTLRHHNTIAERI